MNQLFYLILAKLVSREEKKKRKMREVKKDEEFLQIINL